MNTFNFKNYLAAGGVDQQLTEAQIHEEIEEIFEEFLNDSSNKNLIKEEKEQIDEAIGGLIVGGILSAPKLIALLGKLIKKISKVFGKDTSEEGVGAWIEKKGEQLEGTYIKLLMKAIQLTGLAKKVWKKEDGSVDKEKLHDTAEVIFAVILTVAAASAGGTAISALKSGSGIMAAIEGGLTGIKSAEILAIVQKVGSKLVA
jgi:hypothetical protein